MTRIRRAVGLVEGSGALGGWAAAYLHGFTDLDGRGGDGAVMPLLLCLSPQSQRRRDGDHRGLRSALRPDELVRIGGVPVTGLVRSAADLARLSTSLEDAVAR